MKLRLFCVAAALFVSVAGAQAADGDKTGDASGGKKLSIPSLDIGGGGSLGVSTDKPGDPNVPTFNDPDQQNRPVEPFVGLKFTKPLGGK